MQYEEKTGAWGQKMNTCLQCGACCYQLYERFGRLCPEQEIRDGKSYCRKHPFKEPLCEDYFCSDSEKIVKTELRKCAELLGTVPK